LRENVSADKMVLEMLSQKNALSIEVENYSCKSVKTAKISCNCRPL
jgi:hypothetical protein